MLDRLTNTELSDSYDAKKDYNAIFFKNDKVFIFYSKYSFTPQTIKLAMKLWRPNGELAVEIIYDVVVSKNYGVPWDYQ